MTGPSPASSRFLTGPQVCQLLNISKSTLAPWRASGALVFLPLPNGGYRYPEDQPLIRRALALLASCGAIL